MARSASEEAEAALAESQELYRKAEEKARYALGLLADKSARTRRARSELEGMLPTQSELGPARQIQRIREELKQP